MTNFVSPAVEHAHGTIMGGPWQICHVPRPGIHPDAVAEAAFHALQLVDRQMSHYKDDSDLMRLNRAPINTRIEIPASMATVMAAAKQIADFTAGALDITLGKTVNAWGFGPQPQPETLPDPVIRPDTDVRKKQYTLHNYPPAVYKHADIAFNLCALAKGYAVDEAARAVAVLGIENFLIEAAGEVYAQGQRPDGSLWQVGLELPVPGKYLVYGQIPLNHYAVATSGSYRKSRTIADREYPHTIDPRTGTPVSSDLLAVSVLDPCCMRADALATALFIQGREKGSAFAQQHRIAALFLSRTEDGICEIRSQAWIDYLSRNGE